MGMDDARAALDALLLGAHQRDDKSALVGLYRQAAETANDPQAAAFYMTHAYVFALDIGDGQAQDLHATLVAMGREE